MNSALKQKLRNWLVIYAVMTVVIVVVEIVSHLFKLDINSFGPGFVAGGSVWYALEGEKKFAEFSRKKSKQGSDETKW